MSAIGKVCGAPSQTVEDTIKRILKCLQEGTKRGEEYLLDLKVG
jgi:hypothetical protein